MQNSMVIFTFYIFGWKYPVWDNVVQKIKIVSLRWNLIPRLIRICWIKWCCLFLTRNTLLGQIWSKLSIFTVCFVSDQKCSFWENLVQNVKIVSLRLIASLIRIWNKSNSNVQNSKVVFTDFVFGRKCPFLGKFGWKSQND